MEVSRYVSGDEGAWNEFVSSSKNGTFLFDRNFMDYHSNRFEDHSLMIRDMNKIVALLPANKIEGAIHSHLGLSYGGFIVDSDMRAMLMLAVFEAVIAYFKKNNIKEFYYKSIPYIYHTQPAEEDLYALFRNRAVLYRRDIATVISCRNKNKYSKRPKCNIKKSKKENICVVESEHVHEFHRLLESVLARHKAKPVHTAEEIILLKKRFPENIKLHAIIENDDLIAGTIVFDTGKVAHTQYLASSERGRAIGALDLIISTLIEDVYKDRDYFSFGPSTEEQGQRLNEGLIRQKEGFGGRSIVHDFYKLNIA